MPRLCKEDFIESTWKWSDFVPYAAEAKVLFEFDFDRPEGAHQ
jgi:hypothetical protein